MKMFNITLFPLLLAFVMAYSACNKTEKQKDFVIGVLNPNKGTQNISDGFMESLQELRKKHGGKVTFIKSDCYSKNCLDDTLKGFIQKDVDMIFSVTTPATLRAKEITRDKNIPVIFTLQDPAEAGLIKSLTQPGDNLTGIQIRGSVPKAVEWLLSVSPGISNIYVPIKHDTGAAKMSLADLQGTAEALDIKVTVKELNNNEELDKALAEIPDDVDALFLLCSIFIQSNTRVIVEAATKNRLPTGSGAAQCGEGVLVSYGMDGYNTGKQASRLANLVLQGEYAGNIPVEVADFFLGINLQTANKIDRKVSQNILQQADHIIR